MNMFLQKDGIYVKITKDQLSALHSAQNVRSDGFRDAITYYQRNENGHMIRACSESTKSESRPKLNPVKQ